MPITARAPAHLGQLLFRGKAEAIHSVGTTVCPLPELLRGLGEGHVGGDCAVDDSLGVGRARFKISRNDNDHHEPSSPPGYQRASVPA